MVAESDFFELVDIQGDEGCGEPVLGNNHLVVGEIDVAAGGYVIGAGCVVVVVRCYHNLPLADVGSQ